MYIVNKYISYIIIICLTCLFLSACSSGQDPEESISRGAETSPSNITDMEVNVSEDEAEEVAAEEKDEPPVFSFFTAYGEKMDAYLQESVRMHDYDWSYLEREGEVVSYEDETYTSRWGVDVSSHNQKIDWETVKEDGASFAFVRVGYRGYGTEGKLCTDEYGVTNIDGAKNAGLDVGVYFFSQSVSEEEALEEAEMVLEILDGRELELPIVFDLESIMDDAARTDGISGKQFTQNAITFCDRIREAGYEPMIYCNLRWEAYIYDLEQLSDLEIWYADYEAEPQTPYHFTIWQYTESGQIPGIQGDADLNVQLIRKKEE